MYSSIHFVVVESSMLSGEFKIRAEITIATSAIMNVSCFIVVLRLVGGNVTVLHRWLLVR